MWFREFSCGKSKSRLKGIRNFRDWGLMFYDVLIKMKRKLFNVDFGYFIIKDVVLIL